MSLRSIASTDGRGVVSSFLTYEASFSTLGLTTSSRVHDMGSAFFSLISTLVGENVTQLLIVSTTYKSLFRLELMIVKQNLIENIKTCF